eukprot:9493879-Prorocentrum_lima.AAC.1
MWSQPPWRQSWQWNGWKTHQNEPSYHRRERRQITYDRTLWRVAQATNRLNKHHSTQAWDCLLYTSPSPRDSTSS